MGLMAVPLERCSFRVVILRDAAPVAYHANRSLLATSEVSCELRIGGLGRRAAKLYGAGLKAVKFRRLDDPKAQAAVLL